MSPVHSDGRPLGDGTFVRTGLLGFLGPVSHNQVIILGVLINIVSLCYVADGGMLGCRAQGQYGNET